LRQDIEEFRQRGAQVVAIAPERAEDVVRFTRENPFPFPLLPDESHATFDAYDVVSRMASLGQRPAVFIVDRRGQVVFDSVGTQQWQIPGNRDVLARLDALAPG
jgi:peroxiredoxin Q/BCP